MSDYNHLYQQGLYNLSPDQQDLLLAALSSNNPSHKQSYETPAKPEHSPGHTSSNGQSAPPSGGFDNSQLNGFSFPDDESPFLDFNPEVDFEFPDSANLIGDLPGDPSPDHELGGKRKSMDGKPDIDPEETGKKRRESEAKKPGRKPLTSEPTTKRKAQNRAAQRAFRERKEKHLKDLETKVEELQRTSDSTSQENGLLRAQSRKWALCDEHWPAAQSHGSYGLQNTDFLFDFPKFGDLPGSHIFNGQNKVDQSKAKNSNETVRSTSVLSRDNLNGLIGAPAVPSSHSSGTPPCPSDFRQHPFIHYFIQGTAQEFQSQLLSSSGTSPEPSLNSPPDGKQHDASCGGSINGEESFCAKLGMACGNVNNPIPAVKNKPANEPSNPKPPVEDSFGFDWLSQQNGGQFDPVLFGDWREPQDAVLSQDFGSFFNDAFPLPDLGSPSHNLSEASTQQQQPKKPSPLGPLDEQVDVDEEVVPGEDKTQMLSCTKIWDRLQSMEKFRNGEIDVDNLCSELRTKARCSEGGVVVNQDDVDAIMGRVK
ncbi:AP-1-like transcription factor napA [Penicillium chermesinum]|uniref:AP-1-like transcription factor napA n=1 Tax=Penicillium chermesinum TaxID=63820 RepID=A0A9W9TJU9_9EURO|nr:AP-1-like transcription factor napA [Penicillium chermesinum]KAJ5223880.1 AP-1-like transcription factor napA [Penicillium chermesinum]